MSDLVKRLQDPANSGAACKVLVLEAADEIERLTRNCVDGAQTNTNLRKRIEKYEAFVGKVREARKDVGPASAAYYDKWALERALAELDK